MCTCASCSYTDSYGGMPDLLDRDTTYATRRYGFADWPRLEPAGKRVSDAAYTAHVAHLWEGVYRRPIAFEPGQAPIYPTVPGLVHNVAPNATAIRWNAGRGRKYVAPVVAEISTVQTVSLVNYARRLRAAARAERQIRRAA